MLKSISRRISLCFKAIREQYFFFIHNENVEKDGTVITVVNSLHCIDGTTCNHVTGLCDGGCDTGWTGSVCDKGLLEIQLNIILIMCIFNFL